MAHSGLDTPNTPNYGSPHPLTGHHPHPLIMVISRPPKSWSDRLQPWEEALNTVNTLFNTLALPHTCILQATVSLSTIMVFMHFRALSGLSPPRPHMRGYPGPLGPLPGGDPSLGTSPGP
jgi:hypothetical protein